MIPTGSPHIRRRRALVSAALILASAGVVLVGVSVHASASGALSPLSGWQTDGPGAPPAGADAATGDAGPSTADDGVVTSDDGILPDGVTAFDDSHAGITRLSPDLLAALRQAAADASHAGIVVHVNSGWRSPEYQEQLLADAVSQYGSLAEASRWVATPATSAHVAGEAVDIGSYDAVDWMSQHGAAYGLCQTYSNESWHFELRPQAIGGSCPSPYRDPTQDPRMQG